MILPHHILLIDDDEYVRLSGEVLLSQHFSKVECLDDPAKVAEALKREIYDVVLLDMNFQPGHTDGTQGQEVLQQIRTLDPAISVVLITAFGDISLAVETVKNGAFDFILKPWQNEKLLSTIRAAAQYSRSQRKILQLQSQQNLLQADMDQPHLELIGHSSAMKAVFSSIQKVAKTDADVLILGENGTGKELVARALHRASQRAKELFINVDLGSISESLFESEMFGHVKGAFTDAREDRAGRFEAASGGTILLDEIGNLSLPLQAKLLTVLQRREVLRVGSHRPIPIDIRLISATNKPIKQMVQEGTFRQDLLYRVNTVEIVLPPLRERLEDIPLLAHFFLRKYAHKYQKTSLSLPDYVTRKLQKHHWPGNVRELQHAVERAVIMSEANVLHSRDFAFLAEGGPEPDIAPTFNIADLEKWAIQQALRKHQGNVSKVAEEVGLTRGTLYRRMAKYGL